MHPLQQLMNQINQILAALLAIWLKLRNTRQAKGLTIEEAAELIGVAPGTYSRWERLRRKPHPPHQLLLLQTFGRDIEEVDESVPDELLAPSYWN